MRSSKEIFDLLIADGARALIHGNNFWIVHYPGRYDINHGHKIGGSATVAHLGGCDWRLNNSVYTNATKYIQDSGMSDEYSMIFRLRWNIDNDRLPSIVDLDYLCDIIQHENVNNV